MHWLAESIMQSKAAPFDPTAFTDHDQDAFFEIVKAKVEAEEPVFVEEDNRCRGALFLTSTHHRNTLNAEIHLEASPCPHVSR